MASPQAARRALNELLARADDFAFKGTMHPSEHSEIETRYLLAINRIEELLGLKLTKELKDG